MFIPAKVCKQFKESEGSQWATPVEDGLLPDVCLTLPLNEFELNDRCFYRESTFSDRIQKQLQKAAIKIDYAPPIAGHSGIYRIYTNVRSLCYFNILQNIA